MFESSAAQKIKNPPGIRELPPHLRIQWTKLQQSFEDLGLNILAYPALEGTSTDWQLYLKAKEYHSPFSSLQKLQYADKNEGEHPANIDLLICFNQNTKVNEKTWKQLADQLDQFIIGISTSEIKKLRNRELRDHLTFYHRVITNFPFSDLFQSIKKGNFNAEELTAHLANQAWELFKAWVFTMRQMGKYLPLRMSVEDRLFDFPDALTFKKQLPTTQYLLILMQSLCIRILDYGNPAQVNRYLKNAHPEVKRSLETNTTVIYAAFDRKVQKGETFKNLMAKGKMKTLKKDFLKLVQLDLALLLYQCVVVNDHNTNLKEHYHFSIQQILFNPKGDLQTWMTSVSSYSLTDRILHLSSVIKKKNQANIWPSEENILQDAVFERFNASECTIREFQDFTAKSNIPKEKLDKAYTLVKKQWHYYFLQLCNRFTFPLFKYTLQGDQLVPQWNLLPMGATEELLQSIADWQAQKNKHQEKLNKYLRKLKTPKPQKRKVPLFAPDGLLDDPDAQKKIHKQQYAQDNLGRYRQQKMAEFGILYDDDETAAESEIWLNEILTIEKEISPYVIFVKKAFHSALPVRKTVVINHDRHSADGVDFDPQTIQDPEKWMRGDIMSTMKLKIKRGNAAQINCFVLDASGSMEHERMRNLFKILCLMVMGLEDRKSFDAFHFFSYNFIEAANFSESYTNRSLLFKVLKSIAYIKGDQVEFAGNGGTNMGEGIKECYRRMEAFHRELQEKNPGTLYLKSLFVITDGEPSVGIIDPKILHKEIKKRRDQSQVAIKGIYLKPKDELENEFSFMEEIFGKDEFVETDEFATAINELVFIMAQTYKKQRVNLRYQNKQS